MTVLHVGPDVPLCQSFRRTFGGGAHSLPASDTPASSPAPLAHLVSDGLLQELLPSAQRHLVEERSDGGAVETTCAQTHFSTGVGQDVWESCPSESWEQLPEVKVKPTSGSGHLQGAAAWAAWSLGRGILNSPEGKCYKDPETSLLLCYFFRPLFKSSHSPADKCWSILTSPLWFIPLLFLSFSYCF